MLPQVDQRVEIELLKKDVNTIASLCQKFDSTIDKMQEIASNLSKMVSLQEQRMENQESTTKDIQSIIEMRRIEHNNDIKELHSRITTVNRELSDRLEETEKAILKELQEIRKEIKESHSSKDDNLLAKRISQIETWKYMMVGGIVVITWVLAKSDLSKFFNLIF
jgi:hypothetical protein